MSCRLSVFKQMGQMFGLAKGVFCSSFFILRGASLIVQTAFRDGLSFDPFSFGEY